MPQQSRAEKYQQLMEIIREIYELKEKKRVAG